MNRCGWLHGHNGVQALQGRQRQSVAETTAAQKPTTLLACLSTRRVYTHMPRSRIGSYMDVRLLYIHT
jgi:hypothetical protein